MLRIRKLPTTGVDEGLFTGLVTLLFAGCAFGLVSRKGCKSSHRNHSHLTYFERNNTILGNPTQNMLLHSSVQ